MNRHCFFTTDTLCASRQRVMILAGGGWFSSPPRVGVSQFGTGARAAEPGAGS